MIDDEADARDLIQRLLAERGAQVVLAESADRGLELVQSEKPDLILSDVGMPDKDGYDLSAPSANSRPTEAAKPRPSPSPPSPAPKTEPAP